LNALILKKEIDKTTSLINPLLVRLISQHLSQYKDLKSKINYNLKDIGLRIRPFLLRMGYEIEGENFRAILPIPSAIELMQISTLIIDDILDESATRNGRDSACKKWGTKNAILIGEILKSLSTSIFIQSVQENKNLKNILEVLELFENTYGHICIGQYLDLKYEQKNIIKESEYLDMIRNTTALFIQSPITIGALLAGISRNLVNSLSSYGLSLGYAYQIRDDVIDLIGEEKFTGKPFAGDIKRKKKRLPIVHAFLNAPNPIKERLHTIYRKNKISDRDAQEIVTLLYESGSIKYSIRKVKQFSEEAKASLKQIKNQRIKNLLFDLADIVSTFEN
jgi:geranylgeranyl diphosphate synthase type I